MKDKEILASIRDGLSIAEIAELHKIKESAVKKSLTKMAKQGYLEEYEMPACAGCPMANMCGSEQKEKARGEKVYILLSLTAMVLSVLLIYGMALCRYVLTPEIIVWTGPVAVLQVFVFWRHARHWDRPEKVYQGLLQAALLGILLEILVVLNLANVIGAAA